MKLFESCFYYVYVKFNAETFYSLSLLKAHLIRISCTNKIAGIKKA